MFGPILLVPYHLFDHRAFVFISLSLLILVYPQKHGCQSFHKDILANEDLHAGSSGVKMAQWLGDSDESSRVNENHMASASCEWEFNHS